MVFVDNINYIFFVLIMMFNSANKRRSEILASLLLASKDSELVQLPRWL